MQKCFAGDKPSKKKTMQDQSSNKNIMYTLIIHSTKEGSNINYPIQLGKTTHNLSNHSVLLFKYISSQMSFQKLLKLLIHADQNPWPASPNKSQKS